MIPCCNFLSWCFLISIAALVPGYGGAAAEHPANPKSAVNRYGLPVIDETGRRKTYGAEELKAYASIAVNAYVAPPETLDAGAVTTDSITRPLWTYPVLSSGLGLNLWAGTTSDSTVEIYAGSGNDFDGNRYWAALRVNPATGTCEPFFCSQDFSSRIKELQVGDVTGDGEKEIVILTGNGEVHVYDQPTKQWIKSYGTISAATAMRLYDLYGSEQLEVVVCNASSTSVFTDGFPLWSVPAGGEDLTINQMDSDPGPDFALSSGKVVDATIRFVQWDRGTPFGVQVHSHDFDGDGMAEVIAAEQWYNVRAFDVDTQMTKWTYPVDLDISALALTDFDMDGNIEVAIGDGQFGDVYAIDPVTTAQKYLVPNPNHGVAGIAMADVDSDGALELLWGGGFSSTGPDSLYIANPVSKAIEYSTVHYDGAFFGPVKGDLDGDGKSEIVTAILQNTSFYDYYRLLVFDDYSLKLRAVSQPLAGGNSSEGYADLQLADMDMDGLPEILFCGDKTSHGIVEAYNFDTSNTFTLKWNSPQLIFMPYTCIDTADVDGDGTTEIIAGNSRVSSTTTGTCLRVIDYATTTIEWSSSHLGGFSSRIADVAVGNLDTTPGLEMLALTANDDVFIYDGATKALKHTIVGSFRCMDVHDHHVFVADGLGYIRGYSFNGLTYDLTVPAVRVVIGPIEGFEVLSANPLELTFSSAGRLMYYANGAVQSQSVSYGAPFGARYEEDVTGGMFSLAAFRLPPPELNPEPLQTSGTVNQVSWARVMNAQQYLVESSISTNFDAALSSGWITTNNYEFTALQPGQQYHYRVKGRAFDGITESAWSMLQSSEQEPAPSEVSDWTLY